MTSDELAGKTPAEAYDYLLKKRFQGFNPHTLFTFVLDAFQILPTTEAEMLKLSHEDAAALSGITLAFYNNVTEINADEWRNLFQLASQARDLIAVRNPKNEKLNQVAGYAKTTLQNAHQDVYR